MRRNSDDQADMRLIESLRNYDEEKDPGQYKRSDILKQLAKRAGTKKYSEMMKWVEMREQRLYDGQSPNLIPELLSDSSEESAPADEDYLAKTLAQTDDPEKRAFFERLIKSRSKENRRSTT
jgi:hypothetical protein